MLVLVAGLVGYRRSGKLFRGQGRNTQLHQERGSRELARYNVCANVISLGIVETDMTEKLRSDEKLTEIYINRILLKKFASTDDITPAFVFLASSESGYATGTGPSGGWRLWNDLRIRSDDRH